MMNSPRKLFYEFGEFRLDTEKHRLLRDDEIVALTPKAVETLTLLVQQRGRLVERDDLMNSVWPGAAVEPGNLDVTISKLRKALGESGNGRKFIETVPRLGYKFVADVREVVVDVPRLVVEKQTVGRIVIDEQISFGRTRVGGAAVPLPSAGKSLKAMAAASLVVVILAVGLLAYLRPWKSAPPAGTPSNISSIAVLPFKVIDSQNRNPHEGLGLADILITRLSNLNRITVRPASAVTSFENAQQDALTIAHQLQVDAVLEGTIYRTADKVRVTSRLLRVSDQSTIWSGQFERLAKDELLLQNEISLQIANALALNLSSGEKTALSKRYTESADAYQLYVQGRYEWNKRTGGGLSEAERLFRNAIEKDPDFALAYVGVADSLVFLNDKQNEVGQALTRAIELDPNLGEAYATLGFQQALHYWQWKEAEASFKKSLALNPGYATAHQWYATLLGIQGRIEEAKTELKRALEINPNSYNLLTDMGQLYYFNREYEKAKEFCERALALNPDFPYAHGNLSRIYLLTGQYEASIEAGHKRESAASRGRHESAQTEQARAAYFAKDLQKFRQLGFRKYSEDGLAKSQAQAGSSRDPSLPFGWAEIYAFLGDKPKALESLEKAYDNKGFMMAWVKVNPFFASLHSEPRYQAILKNMGL